MNQAMIDVLIYIGFGVGMIVMSLLIYNFLSKGYLITLLRVKGSRGKFMLARAIDLKGIYYSIVKFPHDQNMAEYKSRGGLLINNINLHREDVYPEMGVQCFTYDEVNKKIVKLNGDSHDGHDTSIVDSIIKRIRQRPLMQQNILLFLLVLAILTFIVVCVCAYMITKLPEKIVPMIVDAVKSQAIGVI